MPNLTVSYPNLPAAGCFWALEAQTKVRDLNSEHHYAKINAEKRPPVPDSPPAQNFTPNVQDSGCSSAAAAEAQEARGGGRPADTSLLQQKTPLDPNFLNPKPL